MEQEFKKVDIRQHLIQRHAEEVGKSFDQMLFTHVSCQCEIKILTRWDRLRAWFEKIKHRFQVVLEAIKGEHDRDDLYF